MVASTIVGRIRCCTADQKAAGLPASRLSISMKPVTLGKNCVSEIRPETGVQPSVVEKRMMSSSAHQKIGIE